MILALVLTSGILSQTDVNVVLVPDRASSMAQVRVAITSGSAEDPPGKEGLAWATARAIMGRAGSVDLLDGMTVSVERDATIFSASVKGGKLDSFLDALAPILIRPIDPATGIGPILSAREEEGTDPVEIAFDAILFAGHPYAHPPEGTSLTLGRITGQDLADFHAAQYVKGNLAIGVAGAVGSASLERIRSDFDGLADGEPSRTPKQPSFPTVPRIFVIETPGATLAILRIGQPITVTRKHPDHADLLLAARCLDPAPAGPGIRIGSDRFGRRLGALRIAMEVSPSEAGEAVRHAVGDLLTASREGVPGSCLATAAAGLSESVRTLTPEEDLELRLTEFLHGDGGYAQRFGAVISKPTPETVRAALSRHLFPDRLSILAMVPDAGAFIEQLRSSEVLGWRRLAESDFEITSVERTLRQEGF